LPRPSSRNPCAFSLALPRQVLSERRLPMAFRMPTLGTLVGCRKVLAGDVARRCCWFDLEGRSVPERPGLWLSLGVARQDVRKCPYMPPSRSYAGQCRTSAAGGQGASLAQVSLLLDRNLPADAVAVPTMLRDSPCNPCAFPLQSRLSGHVGLDGSLWRSRYLQSDGWSVIAGSGTRPWPIGGLRVGPSSAAFCSVIGGC